jgi:predicted RNase H-like nuclease (RuvC/YqgF family)
MAGKNVEKRTKTQKKNDSIARYKWLKVVFSEIDHVKARVDELEKTVKYLRYELDNLKEGEKSERRKEKG